MNIMQAQVTKSPIDGITGLNEDLGPHVQIELRMSKDTSSRDCSLEIEKTIENFRLLEPKLKFKVGHYYQHKTETNGVYVVAWVTAYWVKLINILTGRFAGEGAHFKCLRHSADILYVDTDLAPKFLGYDHPQDYQEVSHPSILVQGKTTG